MRLAEIVCLLAALCLGGCSLFEAHDQVQQTGRGQQLYFTDRETAAGIQ